MAEFVMAIPSYQRADKQKTLEYLSGIGMPKERLYIFVQTKNDEEAYQRYTDRCNVVFAPACGVAGARNNILRYFSGKKDILMLDDDVSYIGRLSGKKTIGVMDGPEFERIVERCFAQAGRAAAPIWGVYPVDNGFFMQRSISTKVTVNTAVGFTKGRILSFNETFTAKEDIELCARVLHEGGTILRYNFLSVNAEHRTNKGGCYEAWHSTEQKIAVARLCRMYPDVLAENAKKPNEVRTILRDKKIMLDKEKQKWKAQ